MVDVARGRGVLVWDGTQGASGLCCTLAVSLRVCKCSRLTIARLWLHCRVCLHVLLRHFIRGVRAPHLTAIDRALFVSATMAAAAAAPAGRAAADDLYSRFVDLVQGLFESLRDDLARRDDDDDDNDDRDERMDDEGGAQAPLEKDLRMAWAGLKQSKQWAKSTLAHREGLCHQPRSQNCR